MKKLVLLVSMIMTLAFSMVAFAAGDGSVLNSEEKIAEKFFTALTSQNVTLAAVEGSLSPNLQKGLTAKVLEDNRKVINEKWGSNKGLDFAGFARLVNNGKLTNNDRVTYLTSFSKVGERIFFVDFARGEKPVIVNFGFAAQQQAPAAPAKK